MADGPRLNNDERNKRLNDIEFAIEAREQSRDCYRILNGTVVNYKQQLHLQQQQQQFQQQQQQHPVTNLLNTTRLTMTRPIERDNHHRNAQYRGEFSTRVHRDWVRSKDPCACVTEDLPSHVRSLIARPNNLNLRMGSVQPQNTWTWTFELWSTGKPLRNIALALDDHRDNFRITSVTSERGQRLGTCDGHEWYDNTTIGGIVAASTTTNKHLLTSENNDILSNSESAANSYLYTIEIGFVATSYGTYRQHLLLGFGDYPILRRRLCVDCVHFEDLKRLNDATKYVLHQTSHRWTSSETGGSSGSGGGGGGVVHPFESPFVLAKDPREDFLTKAYPYPVENDFILSHATLTEDRITPQNYRGRMHELISVEELARHEQVARYNRVAQLKLSSSYILSSDTDGSTTAKYAPPGELFAELPLGRSVSEDMKSGRLLLRGCTSILLKPFATTSNETTATTTTTSSSPTSSSSSSGRSDVYQAHVEDKCNYTIYARLSKRCVERLNLKVDTQVKMYVQFLLSRLPFCEWHRAVDCLPDTGLVFPSSDFELISRLPSFLHSEKEWHHLLDVRLNPKQVEAVTTMVAPSEIILPPILLLGPYGTGKTFTIAQALLIMLMDNPRNKVLLCTQSNSAADLYVKEFFDDWYTTTANERLKPMRIYYTRRLRNTVHPLVRKYCLMDQNGHFREPSKEDMDNCGLIVTTLATSSCLTTLDFEPTHIVIDEAAQALECEALTALALASKRTRLILAGDQMQLAPEVYSDLAAERGLGVSLLERIHNMYSIEHPCRIRLCQNYRSHADIVRLTSSLFYGSEIEPGCTTLPAHPAQTPLMFYAVHGMEVQGEHSTGFYNDQEAVELAERVASLKRFWPVEQWGAFDEDSIGVLAHYAEQVIRIRNELRKRRLFKVSVERVLNVQGKQFTAVFISTVRTTKCCRSAAESNVSDYGFLTNPRLLNTAITRAKSLVAVVGDPVALLTIGSCRTLWAKYFETATIRGFPLQKLQRYMVMCFTPQSSIGVPLNPLAREFVPRDIVGTNSLQDWLGCPPNTEADCLFRANNAWPTSNDSTEFSGRPNRRV